MDWRSISSASLASSCHCEELSDEAVASGGRLSVLILILILRSEQSLAPEQRMKMRTKSENCLLLTVTAYCLLPTEKKGPLAEAFRVFQKSSCQYCVCSSTRRFLARPAEVLLSAIGLVSP